MADDRRAALLDDEGTEIVIVGVADDPAHVLDDDVLAPRNNAVAPLVPILDA